MAKTVKVTGLKETKIALRKLPDATAKNVMRRVLRKGGKLIIDAAKSRVPKDDGDLLKSLRVGTRLSSRQKRNFRKRNPHDVMMFVGAGPLPQAHLQEFGTKNHTAQPFLRPAWDANKRKVLDNIRKDMWQEIRKAAERLARKARK